MTDSIKRLKELVGSSDNIVFFGGGRRFHRVRHPGLSQHWRPISPRMEISA